MLNRRILGPLLTIVLILGVGAAIFYSARDQILARQIITIRGVIGSEKEDFFQDERVIEELRRNGLAVQIDKAGSRQIATSFDLSEYDFAFPAGVPAAEKIRQKQGISASYDAFFTPMAIATWHSIADILVANELAKDEGGYYTLDVARYLQFVKEGTHWSDLENNAAYDVNKSILVTSTDIRRSNSAAMYLALSSFVANGNRVVQNDADIANVLPLMESLFLEQGYTEYSSEVPFEDYLVMGMGKAPMVMIYEAQYIYQSAQPNGGITEEMVLMYPSPNIFTKHILVPLSEEGARLGELLTSDPALQRLVVEHGFRNNETTYFREFSEGLKLSMPQTQVNVVEPPAYEVLEKMIQQIELKYQ